MTESLEAMSGLREALISELSCGGIEPEILKYDRLVVQPVRCLGPRFFKVQDLICQYCGVGIVLEGQKAFCVGRKSLVELASTTMAAVIKDCRKPDWPTLISILRSKQTAWMPKHHARTWQDFILADKIAERIAQEWPHGGQRIGGVKPH